MNRDTAIDAVDVLNDLIADLTAGTNVFRDYRQRLVAGQFRVDQMSAVQKMCFSHLVLAFCKLLEFWEHYQRMVPDAHRKDVKDLVAEIRRRGTKDFRNKVVGHIWDKKHRRPVRLSEINAYLERLIGNHADEFLNWVNNLESNPYPETIVSVVETMRDAIMRQHSIDPSEILKR